MVELILERVDKGVVGAVEEERLFTEDDKICLRKERRNITGVEGSWAASLSMDMSGVMPVPPPMNTLRQSVQKVKAF